MGGDHHQHGAAEGDFRTKVWSMTGGPNCRPKHWKRNTAIAMFGIFLTCIPIAMISVQLEENAKLTWGDDELPCISLSMPGVSAMHKLRPRPSWDRTCTAAAAIGLLAELHTVPSFSTFGLENQAEAVDNGLDVLLDALTAQRLRMGRSIIRRERRGNHIPNSQGSL